MAPSRTEARELLRRLAVTRLDLDVLEPQVEAAEDRAGVEGPLRDQVAACACVDHAAEFSRGRDVS